MRGLPEEFPQRFDVKFYFGLARVGNRAHTIKKIERHGTVLMKMFEMANEMIGTGFYTFHLKDAVGRCQTYPQGFGKRFLRGP